MEAKVKPGYDDKRTILKDVVPLDTPYTLFISPSQLCNFRCHFCAQSLSNEEKKQKGLIQINQDMDVFLKIVEQSKKFPNKFKRILLTGLGEPLMNKNIAKMIEMVNEAEISEKIEMFTNAALLNHKLSDDLINAGLTKLRISTQGTDAAMYKKHSGVDIDFDKFVSEIKYFYEKSRGKCQVYIKIIEEELRDANDREKFFDIFGNICDEIYVENLTQAQPAMGDYENKIEHTRTFYGEKAKIREVCPYIFYSLQTDSEGNCFPCPPLSLPLSFSIGNINDTPITKIWNGKKHKDIMISHLNGNKCDLCKKCTNYLCFTPDEDNLDMHKEEILERLNLCLK